MQRFDGEDERPAVFGHRLAPRWGPGPAEQRDHEVLAGQRVVTVRTTGEDGPAVDTVAAMAAWAGFPGLHRLPSTLRRAAGDTRNTDPARADRDRGLRRGSARFLL